MALIAVLSVSEGDAFTIPRINVNNAPVNSAAAGRSVVLQASVAERPAETEAGPSNGDEETATAQNTIAMLKEEIAKLETQMEESSTKIAQYEKEVEESSLEIIGLKRDMLDREKAFDKELFDKEEHINKIILVIEYHKGRFNEREKVNAEYTRKLEEHISALESERESFRSMAKQAIKVAGRRMKFW
eukprot:CAMPEP_0198121240 /NCGR_PEP_ID=MMETSP1442-20131203/31546_1 /TAXON_ID= /ORGANISM="Craspedostauros australis, Strain CCMP3328" /LENGTH=187 /DNA_ID=CAMNT_0043780011 /DNA_START=113 /DNA_END=676 /DNA_ORIENTATION=-